MKKLILIPTTLIAGLTPVISLVGCDKDQGPKLIVHTDDGIFFTAMG
ncbi:MAG: hypothetical protein MJ233_03630 [Mycoplasmoidaceae bacterium]|nr:hypothetical protein [Mycoplasmoidaceae bacterium]